jgi:hypothetical protein
VVGLNYRRVLRWKAKVSAGEPALTAPGPKKAGQLPLAQLQAEIAALRHGRRRSRGTTELYLHLTITELKEAHRRFHPREKAGCEGWLK